MEEDLGKKKKKSGMKLFKETHKENKGSKKPVGIGILRKYKGTRTVQITNNFFNFPFFYLFFLT